MILITLLIDGPGVRLYGLFIEQTNSATSTPRCQGARQENIPVVAYDRLIQDLGVTSACARCTPRASA